MKRFLEPYLRAFASPTIFFELFSAGVALQFGLHFLFDPDLVSVSPSYSKMIAFLPLEVWAFFGIALGMGLALALPWRGSHAYANLLLGVAGYHFVVACSFVLGMFAEYGYFRSNTGIGTYSLVALFATLAYLGHRRRWS